MTRYTIFAQILKTEEHPPMGWFLYLKGSREGLFIDTEKPEFEAGDLVKVTIQKVENANS